MKTTKFFRVNVECDLEVAGGVRVTFRDHSFYSCEFICTEMSDTRHNIINAVKPMLKTAKIDMLTVDFMEHANSNDYRGKIVDSYRFLNHYSGNKIAHWNGDKYDFDSVDTTDKTPVQFLRETIDDLNKRAFFEYVKTIQEGAD